MLYPTELQARQVVTIQRRELSTLVPKLRRSSIEAPARTMSETRRSRAPGHQGHEQQQCGPLRSHHYLDTGPDSLRRCITHSAICTAVSLTFRSRSLPDSTYRSAATYGLRVLAAPGELPLSAVIGVSLGESSRALGRHPPTIRTPAPTRSRWRAVARPDMRADCPRTPRRPGAASHRYHRRYAA